MLDKKELLEEVLNKISGGKVWEDLYPELDLLIKEAKEHPDKYDKDYIINKVKAAWNDDRYALSDNGDIKDLEEIIAYIEKNF